MTKSVSILALAVSIGCAIAVIAGASRPRYAPPVEQATFAAGCFWGVEAAFRKTDGVTSTEVGYTGGHTPSPNYHDISLGNTGHVEAVRVTYDPRRVGYAELLDVFWNCHDPTIDHEDGPHASVIFFHDAAQESLARRSLDEVRGANPFKRPVATRIAPAGLFYRAEEYHQRYVEVHGLESACHAGPITFHTRLADQFARARLAAR